MKNAARLKVTRTRAVDRLPKAIVNDLKATRYTRRALHGRPLEPVSSKKFRGERFRIALDNSNRPLSENNSKFASDPTTFFEGATIASRGQEGKWGAAIDRLRSMTQQKPTNYSAKIIPE